MATWETVLTTVAFGLGNGGPSGLLYTYIGVWIGFTLVAISMAEMASMAPYVLHRPPTSHELNTRRTAGGQYHWCSEFAPRSCQKQLSYIVGWLGVLGWQIGVTIGAFVSGTILQGLVILSYPTYNPRRWHGTLMAIMVTFITAGFNMFLAKWLPFVEGVILFLHFAGWLAMLVPLWVFAPKASNAEVWNSFLDSGWRNSE
jgi:choline transport protein